jgi:hypothetical protein
MVTGGAVNLPELFISGAVSLVLELSTTVTHVGWLNNQSATFKWIQGVQAVCTSHIFEIDHELLT